MSPDTRAAIEAGRALNKTQFREYIEAEAKAAKIRGGADAAISRAQGDVEPANYRETRLRLSIDAYLRSR